MMTTTTQNRVTFATLQSKVSDILHTKDTASKTAEARQKAKALLARDLVARDQQELFALLRKCTVEIFTKEGRQLRLNPYHVFKSLYTTRYEAIIDKNSERLPEQQFTTAIVNALRLAIGQLCKAATQREKAAWMEVLGNELEVGVKQVQLTTSPIPLDNAMFSFLREKFDMASE